MYYNRDTYSLYFEKYGTGSKKILILPGWGNTKDTYKYIINYFKNNYTIYIFDLLGFGNSLFPEYDLTIYDYTNIIISFMDDNNIINPIVIAHSFGGRLAICLNGYFKEKIDKMIFIDTAGIKPKKNIKKIIKLYTYKILKKLKLFISKKKRVKYLDKLYSIFSSNDYKALPQNMYNTFKNIVNEDLKYYLKSITSEVLIIWGEKDLDTPLKDGYIMNKEIPNSSLVIIKNGTHYVYLNYPSLINNIINEFIKND